MQRPHLLRARDLQLAQRHSREEMVEAEPLSLVVERHHEQVEPLQVVQDRRGVRDADEVVAQRGGEPVEDRHGGDELTHADVVPVEHLFGQVVADEAVAAAECLHVIVGIGPPHQ